MSAPVLLLVLHAAALHAAWNALLRSGANRMWSMTVMCVAIAVTCALAVPFVAVPARASWGCLIGSALLHLGYNVFLVRAYRVGDLGQTYPIARGSAPLLVTLGAAAFAGERLGVAPTVGVVLVGGGIMALAFHGRRLSAASLPSALITGGFIGAYSVTDGIGVRLAGDALGYITWMCLLWGLALPVSYVLLRDVRSLRGPPLRGAQGGWRRYPLAHRLRHRALGDAARAARSGVRVARDERRLRRPHRLALPRRAIQRPAAARLRGDRRRGGVAGTGGALRMKDPCPPCAAVPGAGVTRTTAGHARSGRTRAALPAHRLGFPVQ